MLLFTTGTDRGAGRHTSPSHTTRQALTPVPVLPVLLLLVLLSAAQSAIPSRPSSKLAHVVSCLLSGSSFSSSGGGEGGSSEAAAQHHVDLAALALLDVAQTCVYRITATYGAVLGSVVAGAAPVVGTASESCTLLQTFLDYEQ